MSIIYSSLYQFLKKNFKILNLEKNKYESKIKIHRIICGIFKFGYCLRLRGC